MSGLVLGLTAVCDESGRIGWAPPDPAGTSTEDRPLVPAATLPDGTPHPDPFLAGKGWQVQSGVYVRIPPDGDVAA